MKNVALLRVIPLFLISLLVTSCEVIEGIFEAGVGVGIFIVVAVAVLILYLISRMTKK